MNGLRHNIPEELVFRICEKYLGAGEGQEPMGATAISEWLKVQGFECSRVRVHQLVGQGIQRGYLRLYPPRDFTLAQRLADRFDLDINNLSVLKLREGPVAEHLATRAAEVLLDLIKELSRAKKPEPVHVGFGAGRTIRRVAKALSVLLQAEEHVPALVVHALSSGFSVENPTTAPVVFCSYFTDISPQIQFVGLFASVVVHCKDYADIKTLPGVQESFQARDDIDIVVSSLAQRNDDHALLKRFMEMAPPGGLEALDEAGWVGDIHWRPFSETAPIDVDTEIRAVTMFELDELVEFVQKPGKHALLVVGPCQSCGKNKAEALRPVLSRPELRVFNHLITDARTAEEVLKKPGR